MRDRFPGPARALMLQGTGSDVGKSLLVAGLCRALTRRGLRVRPFKPQNMSNNAAVADLDDTRGNGQQGGGEIGRAQALQARACGVRPTVHMNPVLLKPQSDTGSQVVVQGKVVTAASGRAYQALKPTLLPAIGDSFARLCAEADVVVVEGAGSPAEINLRAGDVANMGFARAFGVPVVLVGDIDRGGVIAQLVGTCVLLDPEDRAQVRGTIVNKFRGDAALFADGLTEIARRTGLPGFGLVPWLPAAARLPAEDSVALERNAAAEVGQDCDRRLVVAVPRLPRIANFDDLDPLASEPGVRVVFVGRGQPLPVEAAVVLLPGSKSTRGDLDVLRAEGWDIDLAAHVRRGGRVVGLCAGFQMLGRVVRDPEGLEGPPGETPGLGLLAVDTTIGRDKTLTEITATDRRSGAAVSGYEMHMGITTGPGLARPWLDLDGRPEGALSADGRVSGSYIHGLFSGDAFRAAFLSGLGVTAQAAYDAGVEAALDALADHLERHLDIAGLLAVAAVPTFPGRGQA